MNKTGLYAEHEHLGATIVPFAGYLMPLHYTSLAQEHAAVRHDAGLFDVSHMGEIFITGPDSHAFVNHLVTNLVPRGPAPAAVYAVLCDEGGHAIDDLFVYPLGEEEYLLVVNASNTDKDEAWMRRQASAFEVDIDNRSAAYGQVALQGPRSEEIAVKMFGAPVAALRFMQFATLRFQGHDVFVSRSGYTGEDGYEFYAAPEVITILWRHLLGEHHVTPCGLGCRDTLRFEGAMSLYGHEIDAATTPLEAGLKFAVNFTKEFIGKAALSNQLQEGLARKLVGLEVTGRGIARADYEVWAANRPIGRVTTGYLLPNHDKALALALIETAFTPIGTSVSILIRNQLVPAIVRDIKFMEKKYKR